MLLGKAWASRFDGLLGSAYCFPCCAERQRTKRDARVAETWRESPIECAWLVLCALGCVGVVCELDSVFVCFLCLFFVFECFWLGLLAGCFWLVGFSGL